MTLYRFYDCFSVIVGINAIKKQKRSYLLNIVQILLYFFVFLAKLG